MRSTIYKKVLDFRNQFNAQPNDVQYLIYIFKAKCYYSMNYTIKMLI